MFDIDPIETKGILRENWIIEVQDYVISCHWILGGSVLLVGDVSGGIYALDGNTGNILWQKKKVHDGNLLAMSINSMGDLFATSGQDGSISIYQTSDGLIKATIVIDNGWVEHLAWSKDNQFIAASASKNVYVFDSSGKEKWRSEQQESTVSALAWSKSNEIAIACYGKVAFFNIDTNILNQKLEWRGSLVSMVLSPDGDIVACGSQDNTVHFWRRSTGEDSMMSGYSGKPSNIAFDHTGKILATGGSEIITVWSFKNDGPEGTHPGQLQYHLLPISSFAFAPGSNRLASGSRDGSLAIWGLKDDGHGGIAGFSHMTDHISTIAWKEYEKALAAGDANGKVKTWKIKT